MIRKMFEMLIFSDRNSDHVQTLRI